MRADDSSPTQPSPNGRHSDAAADGFNRWLDALVAGGDGRTPCATTGDAARLGETARRLQTLASRVDRHGASEAVMERTWEAIMAETLTLDAAPRAVPGVFTPSGHAAVERERHGQVARPQRTGRERHGPRLWRSVRRWQPVVSTAGTLALLLALIAGYAASRGVLPPGGDGNGRRQLAAVGTPVVTASPSPTPFTCDADVDDVREVDRIRKSASIGATREYTPVRQADRETVAAVRTVYERFNACSLPYGIFSSHEYASDRYVRGSGSTSGLSLAGPDAVDRVIDEFIMDDGRVREEFAAAQWWSTPQDADAVDPSLQALQPGNVFVLSDGRVAGLWGSLTIPHEYGPVEPRLPEGIYWFIAFVQEDGRWLVDEKFGVGIGQGP